MTFFVGMASKISRVQLLAILYSLTTRNLLPTALSHALSWWCKKKKKNNPDSEVVLLEQCTQWTLHLWEWLFCEDFYHMLNNVRRNTCIVCWYSITINPGCETFLMRARYSVNPALVGVITYWIEHSTFIWLLLPLYPWGCLEEFDQG